MLRFQKILRFCYNLGRFSFSVMIWDGFPWKLWFGEICLSTTIWEVFACMLRFGKISVSVTICKDFPCLLRFKMVFLETFDLGRLSCLLRFGEVLLVCCDLRSFCLYVAIWEGFLFLLLFVNDFLLSQLIYEAFGWLTCFSTSIAKLMNSVFI